MQVVFDRSFSTSPEYPADFLPILRDISPVFQPRCSIFPHRFILVHVCFRPTSLIMFLICVMPHSGKRHWFEYPVFRLES